MSRFPKTKVITAMLMLGSIPAFAAGEAINEALNSFMVWAFIIAAVMLLMALFALNKALNTIKLITFKKQNRTVEALSEGSIFSALTDAVPVEKEHDILLDHNYDGIMELDNNLPPWWKYGFYLTIIWGIGYFLSVHVFLTTPLQDEEFRTEMAEENANVEAYIASMGEAVDEYNIETLVDAGDLNKGKDIFAITCAACHLADGGGNAIGPNLTDDYWINGDGSIAEVFKVVKYGGSEGSGMQSWSGELSAKKMQQVSSYIMSLRGSTPAVAKEPQGEHFPAKAEVPAAEEGTDEEVVTEDFDPVSVE